MERNTVLEIQKACALRVFNTAVTVWGDGIIEASRKASDVSGFHCSTICKWASDYRPIAPDVITYVITSCRPCWRAGPSNIVEVSVRVVIRICGRLS